MIWGVIPTTGVAEKALTISVSLNSLCGRQSNKSILDKNMTKFRFLPLTWLLAQTLTLAALADAPRERISLDDGWRFTKGDAPNLAQQLL